MKKLTLCTVVFLIMTSNGSACRWVNGQWVGGTNCRLPAARPLPRPHGAPNQFRPRGRRCPNYQPRDCWYGEAEPCSVNEIEEAVFRAALLRK